MYLEFALPQVDIHSLQGQPSITCHDEEPSPFPSGEGHEIGSRRRHQTSRLHKHTSAAGSRSLTETTPARVELVPFPFEIIRWDSILGIQCLRLAVRLGWSLASYSEQTVGHPSLNLRGISRALPLVHGSALHHKINMLQRADVIQGIAGNSDDICQVAGFKRADLSFPVEQLCAIEQIGLQGR